MIEIKHKAKLHNRFDIVVKDIQTGEEEHYETENIILDRLYSEVLCINANRKIGAQLAFGNGAGTLEATRTALFSELGRKSTAIEDSNFDLEGGYTTKRVVINPNEYVGETFTEVGLAHTSSGIETHAMIEDSEGNPISIGPKTDTQEITIYSTFYAEVAGGYMEFPHTTNQGSQSQSPALQVLTGYLSTKALRNNASFTSSGRTIISQRGDKTVGDMSYVSRPESLLDTTHRFTVSDLALKKKQTPVFRLESANGNGKIKSIAFDLQPREEISSNSWFTGIRFVFPNAAFSGHTFTDRVIGTGDGATTGFNLDWDEQVEDSDTIKVDGTIKTRGTDYTIKPFSNGTTVRARNMQGTVYSSYYANTTTFSMLSGSASQHSIANTHFPIYMTYDFGSSRIWNLDAITVNNSNALRRLRHLIVEISTDETNWTEILELTGDPDAGMYSFTNGEINQPFRYLRINIVEKRHSSDLNCGFALHVNNDQIEFTSPPAENAPITGDWKVPYIPKDTGHMVDFQLTMQFGEGVT